MNGTPSSSEGGVPPVDQAGGEESTHREELMQQRSKANISWVTDLLATGGDLSFNDEIAEAQVADIIEQEVELIIDLRQEANDEDLWNREGLYYEWLPTDDAMGHHIPPLLFDVAVREAIKVLRHDRKVLIHCHMGVNRGPSVTYAVLLELGYGVVEAFDLIREKRPEAAVMYAEDALKAHHSRHGTSGRDTIKDLQALRARIDEIWTPEERARIERVIRDHHRLDAYERDR
jgi:dual specificity phosphatase 3